MIFYGIKHIASGKLMPIMKRGKGYTHWHPGKNTPLTCELPEPRLFNTLNKANRSVSFWFNNPNLDYYPNSNPDAIGDYDLDIKMDGRKKEDLKVVKIFLRIKE